ncbi:MAG: hypothetical protein J6A28_03635 [Clostridia bacterium]|nr:hypothetical protein [Clostridia bacterium]
MNNKQQKLKEQQLVWLYHFEGKYNRLIMNQRDDREVIEDLHKIPENVRSEALYAALANYLGLRVLSFIPEAYLNKTLHERLAPYAKYEEDYQDYACVELKNKAGVYYYFPQYNIFSVRGGENEISSIARDPESFFYIKTKHFADPLEVKEYQKILAAKMQAAAQQAEKEGVLKTFEKYYVLTKTPFKKTFSQKVAAKIAREAKKVDTQQYIFETVADISKDVKDIAKTYDQNVSCAPKQLEWAKQYVEICSLSEFFEASKNLFVQNIINACRENGENASEVARNLLAMQLYVVANTIDESNIKFHKNCQATKRDIKNVRKLATILINKAAAIQREIDSYCMLKKDITKQIEEISK